MQITVKKIEGKLFAVTQDGISHGDKVWDELRKTYWTCSDKITCNGDIYWKVLGEISKEPYLAIKCPTCNCYK